MNRKKEIIQYIDNLIKHDKELSKQTKKRLKEVKKKIKESITWEDWIAALAVLLSMIDVSIKISDIISP